MKQLVHLSPEGIFAILIYSLKQQVDTTIWQFLNVLNAKLLVNKLAKGIECPFLFWVTTDVLCHYQGNLVN